MKKKLVLILALFHLTGCPQAGSLFTPGSFDANKTTTGGEKSGDDASDKIVPADSPWPASTPLPASSPPEATGGNPPAGGDAAQFSGTEHTIMMAFQGPIDPKNDNEGVLTGHTHNRLRYGPGFAIVVPADASVPGSGDPYPLEKGNILSIKLLLEKAVVDGKDQYGNDTYGWITEQDGPQLRLRFHPSGKEDCQDSYIDAKVSLSAGGENVAFSNLPLGPGTISFWIFEHLNPSPPLPDWMSGVLPPTYRTTPDFHEGSLVPFADKAACDAWYDSGFGIVGSLLVIRYVDPSNAIRSFPQSAP